MAINPIDTEVFVQNLKQAYTILRQNILICNTMVEMINNFNSLNDNDTQLTQSINEIKQHLAEADNKITENVDKINKLQTDIDNLDSLTNTIVGELSKKISVSDTKAILYGNAPTSASLYNYNVALSEQQLLDDDMSIPTTKWVTDKVTMYDASIPTETEFVTQEDGTYALELRHDGQVLHTDTSINAILSNIGDKNAYFEWSGSQTTPEKLTNVSQLTGNNSFDFTDINKCPSKIICKNNSIVRFSYEYIPIFTNGYSGNVYYYCITNVSSNITISIMNITITGGISITSKTFTPN